jgi:hypothetical protein
LSGSYDSRSFLLPWSGLPRASPGGILARSVSFGALVLASLAGMVVLGPAQGETLVWDAPTACPGAPEVRERLERLLGRDTTLVHAEARVRERASRWHLELVLQWQGHRDARTLEADRCDTLADATVLLVASAADPLAVLDRASAQPPVEDELGVPEPPPAPLREVGPSPVPPRETLAAAGEPDARERPRASGLRDRGPTVGWSGLLDFGSLLRLAAGLGASVGWRWPRARLFAEGLYLPAQQAVSSEPHSRNGRVQLGAARLGACGRLRVRIVELPLCGGLEAGGTRSNGFGMQANLGVLDRWLAMFAHGGVMIPLMPSVAVVGRLEVTVPVAYSEYRFGDDQLYRARPVIVRGGLGLEFRWGPRNGGRLENP